MTHRARAILAAGLLCALPAAATSLIRLDVPDLVRRADRGIVSGRVLSMESAWNEERTMIWTEVTVLVTEDLGAGSRAGETMVFRVPGGEVDGTRSGMIGAPVFHPGEEVVTFATAWPDGSTKVLGYVQGLSRLGAAAEDGAPRLVGGSADGLTLEQLRAAVRAAGVER